MLTKLLVAAVLLLPIVGVPLASAASAPARPLPSQDHPRPTDAACPQRPLDYDPEPVQLKLRGLLDKRQFDQLDQELKSFRTRYGKSECSDRLFGAVFLALMDGAAGTQGRYDAWVAAKPKSAYAWAARGSHYVKRASYARGTAYASSTSDQQFESMGGLLARADADLAKALALDPKLTVAMGYMLTARSMGAGMAEVLGAYGGFDSRVPNSYVLASTLLTALTPRWGGSIEAMLQFARREAAKPGNNADTRRLVSLANCLAAEELAPRNPAEASTYLAAGLADAHGADFQCYFSQGQLLRAEGRYGEAAAAFAQNRKRAGPVNSISKEADSLLHAGRPGEAEALFSKGMVFRTGSPPLYCGRAESRLALGKLDAAQADVQVGLRTDSGEPYCLAMEQKIRAAK
jgi:tetratricopeptide (TPR) repeat protein